MAREHSTAHCRRYPLRLCRVYVVVAAVTRVHTTSDHRRVLRQPLKRSSVLLSKAVAPQAFSKATALLLAILGETRVMRQFCKAGMWPQTRIWPLAGIQRVTSCSEHDSGSALGLHASEALSRQARGGLQIGAAAAPWQRCDSRGALQISKWQKAQRQGPTASRRDECAGRRLASLQG